MAWYGTVAYGMVCFCMVYVVLYGSVFDGMVLYGIVWPVLMRADFTVQLTPGQLNIMVHFTTEIVYSTK